jgi:hypothetical protein
MRITKVRDKKGKTMKITAKDIRDHLGHGLGDRQVTVHRDGTVTYIGTTEGIDYDRHRTRLYAGNTDDLDREIRRERIYEEERKSL